MCDRFPMAEYRNNSWITNKGANNGCVRVSRKGRRRSIGGWMSGEANVKCERRTKRQEPKEMTRSTQSVRIDVGRVTMAGELAICVCRKRSKQLVSGPYHKVLAAPLAMTTSRPRSLASRYRCRRRGCQEDTQESRFAPSGEVTRNVLVDVATLLCAFLLCAIKYNYAIFV